MGAHSKRTRRTWAPASTWEGSCTKPAASPMRNAFIARQSQPAGAILCCSTTSAFCWKTCTARTRRWKRTKERCTAIHVSRTVTTISRSCAKRSASPGTPSGTWRSIEGWSSREDEHESDPVSSEDFFGPEQSRDGLGIGDLPLAHPGERRGERKREHLEEFLVVELRALVLEPSREVDFDPLVRIRDRDVDRRYVPPLRGGVAGLLLELAPGGRERICPRIDLARRDFVHVAPERIAILALHHELARVGERDHRDRSRMFDEFALGGSAVRQPHRVAAHLEQLAVVDQLAGKPVLAEILHVPAAPLTGP